MPKNLVSRPSLVPSSTNEKLDRGVGEAVKLNDCEPSTFASLMIVMVLGEITAAAARERSWFAPAGGTAGEAPTLVVVAKPFNRVWKGEPETVDAVPVVSPIAAYS